MRIIGMMLAAGLATGAAQADEVALLLGNAQYDDGMLVEDAGRVADAGDALDAAGVDVVRLTDGDRRDVVQALRRAEAMAGDADALVIALAGRFVHAGTETWFLPVDAEPETLADMLEDGLPLSIPLALLARHTGRALLVLSPGGVDGAEGLLMPGLGDLEIPQGVGVIVGPPKAAARLLRDTLAVPDASFADAVADDRALTGQGFLPRGASLLTGDAGAASPSRDDAERLAWALAGQRDDADGYRAYLDRYPSGPEAAEARRRLDAISDEPNRAERLAEEALALSADRRRAIQRNLSLLGYDTRGIDGIFGQGTRSALRDWQADQDRAVTGYLDAAQIDRLDAQATRRAAELDAEERAAREEMRRKDDAWWQETGAGNTVEGLRAYLQRYPEGEHAATAQKRLTALTGAETGRREADAWARAQDKGDAAAYRAYLDAFPQGPHADEARAALDRDAARDAARQAEVALNLNPVMKRAAEERLKALGYEPGKVDGEFDRDTRRAIRRYQEAAGQPVTGFLDQGVVVRLLADSLRDLLR
ncbi:Peptidoglycan-binding domain 1 [Oceaniovalibus guishaninsula JLT2003]|uniref:Peptidoglycan-binding domain 1 n=1 Tax=Oceaniovalibus guishaninsula JLT2003 TaxID=1231392 RepID=K2HPH1_9RHOB|nr:peptidoglycan-binding domain-containing protein [Oceaniovalibus guishaninsula]EKE44759.1 Peptidoglycan-binding domain 1 [Oceaniovalibus guishaninsula JLT2003]